MSSAIEGEYIPAPTKNVPVRGILGGTEFGLNTIKAGTKNLLKGGLQAVVIGAALDQLLKGIGWIQGEGGQIQKPVDGASVSTIPANGEYYWYSQSFANKQFSSATDLCNFLADSGGTSSITSMDSTGTGAVCTYHAYSGGSFDMQMARAGSHCPASSSYSSSKGSCISNDSKPVPIADQDWITMEQWIDNQDSKFVQDLLKQQCVGSLAPNRCYEQLRQKQLDMRGPKTVDAGSTTTTSTHANSDGTTSTTVTTTNNKYDITYGPSTFTYNKSSTTTSSTDGKPGEITTTTDQPSDEADPDDSDDDSDDKATPSPCAGDGCDGPKYEKLYEPTKDTKEKALDSYASRVKALPIVSSVAGFFTVSASAGCPSWSTNVSFAVFASMFSYDLVFDFYCQPWFVSMAQYAKIVFSIVCAYLAFRQAILD
ncbi:hypothetical protein ABEH28_14670 [Pseudomonas sp. Ps21-P2]|uniref:hypothetical protein n=1 Tax=Pseudomonas sp. Ps21-P2 TaxID=3080331 RepID=UPI003209B983